MSQVPEDLKYTDSHEWIENKEGAVKMGITDFAQAELGEIVMVELPEVGMKIGKGEPLGAIEAVKTAEDFYSPFDATVESINTELESAPNLINESPYKDGWFVSLVPTDTSQLKDLISAEKYRQIIGE